MSRSRGRRYDDTPKLNIKKVVATIIAIIVCIMIGFSFKKLLINTENTKDVSVLDTYTTIYENNKWGVIDNKGNIVIDLNYDEMIVVPDKNKDIFICTENVNYDNGSYTTKVLNKQGEAIFAKYNNIEPIENTDGSSIWYENNILKYKENGKFGLINFDGKNILDAEYDNIYPLKGIEKSIIIEKDGKKGLVSTSLGEIVIPTEYIEIINLTDSYENGYIVKDVNNKYGIINADKSKVLDVKYDDIKKLTGNNYYVVVEGTKTLVVDSTGKTILDVNADSIEEILVDKFVVIKNSKYGVIDKEGKDIINPEYENLKYAFSNYYIAQKNGKYGIIDDSENVLIDFIYKRISYINTADFIQCENDNYTTDVFDGNLNKVLENVIISEVNIENGYLRVRKDNDYHYYNFKFEEKTNKEVLSTNTLFLVKENGKYGYENKNGERIVDCIYDDAKEQNEFGYCAVKKDGLWGSLNSDGSIALAPSVNLDDYLYVDFINDYHRFNDLKLNIYTK